MSTNGVSLKRRNPNVTFYVGSDNDWDGRMFCFERGPHSLVIQTPELVLPGYSVFSRTPEGDRQYMSTFQFDLEKISTMVKTFVFGKTNWAYLICKDGSYRLRYKEKPIQPIACPPWATLIPETDLIYTKYINAEDREALWNGRTVDCFVGWNDRWRDFVDCEMRGHRLLKGLDVTFEVLGHILRDGEIVGLVTEHPGDDRRVEYEDRAAVYAAVRKVQSRGLIISLNDSNISIHNRKVRLLGMASVRKFSEFKDPDDAAEIFHWQALSEIFDELRQHPNLLPSLRCLQMDAVPFIPVPSPEKPLVTDFFFRMIIHITLQTQDEVKGSRSGGKLHDLPIIRPSRPSHLLSARPYIRQRRLLIAPDLQE
ncbi:hypothetical protein DFH09DRAFT_1148338 [Mycena vulgaris]|nr:hypothetical protein DFH09DRAFT_1148338 [Mycena vulgaris]